MPHVHWDVHARGIPVTTNTRGVYDPLKSLSSPLEITRWVSEGLNMDRFSVEKRHYLSTNFVRWPLPIDPQMQTIRWLTNRSGADSGSQKKKKNKKK